MTHDKICRLLIKEGHRYNVSYGDNLTNHLPMALVALDKMEADKKELQNFYNDYTKKLELLSKKSDFKKIISIEEHLGDHSYFLTYLEFFRDEILSKGYTQVLKEYIPLLIKSPSSCAFHCLIRTSYAVSSGISHEIAMALAYWSSEFISFKTKVKSEKIEVADELINFSLQFFNFNFAPGNISTRMKEVDNLLFKSKNCITFPEYSLASIAEVALNLYAKTENFTLLHGVTATHAFRTLLPYIDDKNLALQNLWQGIVIAFLSTGIAYPHLPPVYEDPKTNWEKIFKEAVKSTDPHTIKLVYTSWEEWKEYANDLYIQIAHNKTV